MDYETFKMKLSQDIYQTLCDSGMENLLNYEAMKKTLAIDIISAERNETLLQKVPHELMEDMAAVYRFVLNNSEAGRKTVLVTKDMLNNMIYLLTV